ncbi:MAG: DUF192 domain-containing protein [Pseudomonadota bacterium]
MKTRFALLALLAATAAQAQNVRFGTTELTTGIHLIKAEVAATDPQRQQGLMFREYMANNAGMVFVFDTPNTQCMWMKNTLIPLSVAFIDADGKIINIEDMQAQTLDSHCSAKPAKFALEMNLGWFKQKHLGPGSSIDGLVKNAK